MRLNNLNLKTTFAVAALAVSSAFFTGCQKEQVLTGVHQQNSSSITLNDGQKRMVSDMVGRIPVLRVYDQVHNQFVDIDFNNRDFSFSTPNSGWNFSNSDGVQWVEAENGGGILFVSANSFGGNSGGTVVAGSSAVDINYTFCFSASDEALGLDLFDFGGDLTGVSAVIGIGGDFEAIMNGEVGEDSDFTDYFWGFAVYIVYDDVASGSYEVLNWLEDSEDPADDLADHAFSYVLDFQNFGLFFSSDGNINVSGGSMSFNGEYLAILDLFLDYDGNSEEEPDFETVPGFGTMGCN